MDRYEAHMQRLMDATRESNFALWNALLTLNGIIASVFSAVAVFEEKIKPMAFFIVLLSMISAALIIENFRCTRDIYRGIGQADPEAILRMTDKEKSQQIDGAVKKHASCGRRETFSYFVLAAQGLAILFLIYWKK